MLMVAAIYHFKVERRNFLFESTMNILEWGTVDEDKKVVVTVFGSITSLLVKSSTS